MNSITELDNYFKLLEQLRVVKSKKEKSKIEFELNQILTNRKNTRKL
jgi:hypothetical protein